MRSTHRKSAEAADLAATIDDGPAYRVATVWVVRDSAGNRGDRALSGDPGLDVTGSSRGWTRALATQAAPPAGPGLVWYN